MRKFRFVLSSHYVGGTNLEELFEFDETYTDEDIETEFDMWVEENTTQDTYFEEIED